MLMYRRDGTTGMKFCCQTDGPIPEGRGELIIGTGRYDVKVDNGGKGINGFLALSKATMFVQGPQHQVTRQCFQPLGLRTG